jgi:hypothetical protein
MHLDSAAASGISFAKRYLLVDQSLINALEATKRTHHEEWRTGRGKFNVDIVTTMLLKFRAIFSV